MDMETLYMVSLVYSKTQILQKEVFLMCTMDDLPAELDRAHCANVCEQLGSRRQVVLTAVDRGSLEAAWGGSPLSLFHVEQGEIVLG